MRTSKMRQIVTSDIRLCSIESGLPPAMGHLLPVLHSYSLVCHLYSGLRRSLIFFQSYIITCSSLCTVHLLLMTNSLILFSQSWCYPYQRSYAEVTYSLIRLLVLGGQYKFYTICRAVIPMLAMNLKINLPYLKTSGSSSDRQGFYFVMIEF